MSMIDTAEIRAHHEQWTDATDAMGFSICLVDDQTYPCDAIRLCDALDDARTDVVLARARVDVGHVIPQRLWDHLNAAQVKVAALRATVTEQAAEIADLIRNKIFNQDAIATAQSEIAQLRAERNYHAKQVIRQAAEIDRLNGVVNEMLTDMSRNTYTAQCKGSVTPTIVTSPTDQTRQT